MNVRDALRQVGKLWRDPEHPARAEAVARTVDMGGLATEESLAFGLNGRMKWLAEGRFPEPLPVSPRIVGVVDDEEVPLFELDEFLAIVLAGHQYFGTLSLESPPILPAFVEALQSLVSDLPAAFGRREEVIARSEALILGEEDRVALSQLFVRPSTFGVAVLDGRETEDEREGLSEDVMLLEGAGSRSVRVVWAPRGLSADAYFESFAHFRAVFPTPSALPGRLKMPLAFLKKAGVPHAVLEDHGLLVSRGDPVPQNRGHLRWVEYDDIKEVAEWLRSSVGQVGFLATRSDLRLPEVPLEQIHLGEAHRIGRDWRPGGNALWQFLGAL